MKRNFQLISTKILVKKRKTGEKTYLTRRNYIKECAQISHSPTSLRCTRQGWTAASRHSFDSRRGKMQIKRLKHLSKLWHNGNHTWKTNQIKSSKTGRILIVGACVQLFCSVPELVTLYWWVHFVYLCHSCLGIKLAIQLWLTLE